MNQPASKGRSTLANMLLFFGLLLAFNLMGYAIYNALDDKFNRELTALNNHFSKKSQLMQTIQTQMGYGQLIHNFKNLVIRGDNDYRTRSYQLAINSNAKVIRQSLRAYKQFAPLNPIEIEAIQNVDSVVTEYVAKTNLVIKLKAANKTISEIDEQVVIDDRMAMQSLKIWGGYLNTEWQKQSSALAQAASSNMHLSLLLLFLGLFLATVLVFELVIHRSLIRPLQTLYQDLKLIHTDSEKPLTNSHISITGAYETRELGTQIKSLMQRIDRQINELQTLRTALDKSTANMMLADKDLNITYMNEANLATLKSVEQAIQKQLPHFVVDHLIGENIDFFHTHPEKQRAMLSQLQQTHIAHLQLGEVHFNIIITPLWDSTGERFGFVVEWKNITEKVMLETLRSNLKPSPDDPT